MGYSNRRRCPGFSFIEIVMAMTILAMLVGISVVTYSEGVQESKRDTALQQLHYISNAIQRWEMVKNSRYSYESLRPLEGEFLKNVEADPWGREYVISLEKGIVYSLGSDGTDTDGSGLSVSFDTDRDVAPAAPAKFTVHRAGNDMNFAWEKPVLNIDGSPIGTDLDHYLLYYRTSAQSTWTVTFPGGQTIGAADESKTFLWSDVVTEGDTVYFNLSAVDTHNNTGPPSQPAGIFVVQETKPVINMFSASPSRCPLGTPFNVRIDVSDGDANLKKITLSGGGVINEVWENATLPNVFHPVISFSKTFTTTTAPFDLKVEAYDGISTVSKTLDTQISFTNAAPRINTLSPGSYNITVDPNAQMSETSNMVEVTYLIEASDGEANLTQLTLEAAYDTDGNPGAEETLSKTWTYGPSGVSLAVESYPWSVLPKTDQTIEVKVTAKDKVGAVSTVKRGTLRFSTDGTPPQHLTYWIDKSNPTMENEDFLRWWIRDRTVDEPLIPNANYFEGDCWSWENESPPVTYHMAISTSSPVNMVDFLANAITVSTTNASSKWVEKSSAGAAKYTLTPGDGLKSGFIFDQTATYYSVLEARNSVGLWSKTSATPLHHSTKNSQNAFGYDSIKPVISEIKIDSLGPVAGTSDVWFDGTLNVSWTTEDYVIPGDMASGVGSGPYSWQYYIIRETTPGYDQNLYVPDTAGTYVTVKSPEFRAMQVESAHPYETARYILNIRARDVAGNWSDFYSAGARLDMTEPTTTVSGPMPVIENAQGGLILASNTILASWFDVFHDPESGIESYDWGVATTNVLGGAIPDIVPWQRVEGFLTNGSYVQNDPPLLTNDIEVYACLRARNYAGRVSQVAFSERAVVDISLETRLSAFPRVGHESMDVVFKSSVEVGGIPDFEYTFLFDGTYANPARRCVISTDLFSITTSYTYSLADYSAGRHSARVSVRDNNGTGTLSIQDIYFELYPSPYVLAVFNASSAVSDLMRFYRSESMSTGYVWEWDCNSRTGIAPIGIEMGPNDRYAIIPFNNTDPLVAPGYTRLTMIGEHGFESNHQGLNFASFAPYLVSDCAVSPDGSNIILGGNGLSFGTGTGWLARILVNPSSGKVYGNPDSDWGSYSVVDGKSIKVNALALWDGGISGAVAAQSSNLGYPNMTNGVAPLELGS
jgi:type II secretory pathway pseudopilin PulG